MANVLSFLVEAPKMMCVISPNLNQVIPYRCSKATFSESLNVCPVPPKCYWFVQFASISIGECTLQLKLILHTHNAINCWKPVNVRWWQRALTITWSTVGQLFLNMAYGFWFYKCWHACMAAQATWRHMVASCEYWHLWIIVTAFLNTDVTTLAGQSWQKTCWSLLILQ